MQPILRVNRAVVQRSSHPVTPSPDHEPLPRRERPLPMYEAAQVKTDAVLEEIRVREGAPDDRLPSGAQ